MRRCRISLWQPHPGSKLTRLPCDNQPFTPDTGSQKFVQTEAVKRHSLRDKEAAVAALLLVTYRQQGALAGLQKKMITFVKPGPENASDTLDHALQAAAAKGIQSVVLASNSGQTAFMLLDKIKKVSPAQTFRPVIVTHVCEFKQGTVQELSDIDRRKLESEGCRVVTAAHALSAGERSFSSTFGGTSRLEVTAHTLRLFGQGTKVALEIGLMARDAGAIKPGEPVIAIGGSGRGADTAIILTPGTSSSLLSSQIHEIICKPGLYKGDE